MLLSLAAPADNPRGPLFMEKALAAVHQADRHRAGLDLIVATNNGRVGLGVRSPNALSDAVLGAIGDEYPNCEIMPGTDDQPGIPEHWSIRSVTLRLVPDLFPTLRHSQYTDETQQFADPIGRLLGTLCPRESTLSRVEIHVRPASGWRHWWATRAVNRLARTHFRSHEILAYVYAWLATHWFFLFRWSAFPLGLVAGRSAEVPSTQHIDTSGSRMHDREDDVQAASDKIGKHLFEAWIRIVVATPQGKEADAKAKIHEISGAFGAFCCRQARFVMSRVRRGVRTLPRRGFLLSHEELATIFHPPTASVRTERLATREFAELEPPVDLPDGSNPDSVVLGSVRFKSRDQAVALRQQDRRRHLYVVGRTGMGKTTMLQNLILSDLTQGRGVGVVDPHGDLIEHILLQIPARRTNDVILIDPADLDHPISFNPLDCPRGMEDVACDGVVSTFLKMFGSGAGASWGPQLEDILSNAVRTLVLARGMTLLDMLRLFDRPDFRSSVLGRVADPVVLSWWQHDFTALLRDRQKNPFASVKNKLRQFLTTQVIRNIIAQRQTRFNVLDAMDNGKVILVNLSKGRIGSRTSRFLGSLLVTQFQLAAMQRAVIPEEHRRDFYLYVDEFQNFATESFGEILSEARKYRLNLTIAHQYIDQLDADLQAAIFGNVGSMVSFLVGSTDAQVLAPQLSKTAGDITPQDLSNLPAYTAYVRLLIDGLPSRPFSMRTQPPLGDEDAGRAEAVRRQSRRQYAPLTATQITNQIQNEFAQTTT